MVALPDVLRVIDQLDEPEALSQEWIDDNSVYASSDGITEEYVHVDDLKELIVPKQELPSIPKFVAEWIVQAKKWGYSISDSMGHATFHGDTTQHDKAMRWSRNNQDIFARAWLDGFTVEEEPLYYVLDKNELPLLIKLTSNSCVTRANTYYTIKETNDSKFYQLTEQEIKDYDERYLAFKEPVEDVEEW